MKKILALVAVVALVAFAAPAFANVNPFMDVPMNHWAYDAIGQLAARGVLSGYPDGTYKGNQPMTRYEAASAVARALAVVDMTKASKQDVEMLKRLVVEFKDELDALGVKVDKIDSRLAVIESRLGGWQMWGNFRFDAKFGSNDDVNDPSLYGLTGKNQFNISRYRLFMRKHYNDKVTFTARMGGAGNAFERYWLDIKFPWDITAMIGRFQFDWQGADGLYIDNDGTHARWGVRGFYFNKPFAMGNAALYVTRPDEVGVAPQHSSEHFEVGARAKLNFNEQLWMSLNAQMRMYDSNVTLDGTAVAPGNPYKENEHTYWVAAGVNFTPDIALKGAYYSQKVHSAATDPAGIGNTETPKAWQAIVDVKQSAIGFTSVWLEYWGIDQFFNAINAPFDWYGNAFGTNLGAYENIMFLRLQQKWNDQWTTFQRYGKGSARNPVVGVTDDTTNWSLGFIYTYTPGLTFELAYDKIENGQTNVNSDNLIRLRTQLNF